MSTCLVTGGAGFLGSHLCDELLKRGNRVICIDNLETGSLANIEHIRTEQFVHLNLDIIEPYHIDEAVDFVYHLASPASPIDYLRLPLHTLKVGSYGTHHTLGLAKKHRARFLIASTSEVYGDPKVHPQPEGYWGHVNPIGPRGVYDEAKRYAEALTMAYHRQQGVDTAIVRIFNTYGPRMRPNDGRAIPTFLRQGLQDRPITVFGDGAQTRSFCYVEDEIRGLIALSESGFTTRSTSATLTSSRFSSWPRRCSRSPARVRRSCSRPFPPTILRSASRTSRWPGRSSTGSRRSISAKVCGGRLSSPASRHSSAPCDKHPGTTESSQAPNQSFRCRGCAGYPIPTIPHAQAFFVTSMSRYRYDRGEEMTVRSAQ